MENFNIIDGNLEYINCKDEYFTDIVVNGDILSDVKCKINGNLIVKGNVEKVKIRCSGNVKIEKSFFGQEEGFIYAKGSFYAHEIINANVRADKDIIVGDIVSYSNLVSNGKIIIDGRGIVIGGNLFSKDCIIGVECGSPSVVETNLNVGYNFIAKKRYEFLNNTYLDLFRQIKFKRSSVKNLFDLNYDFAEIDQIIKNLDKKDKKRALLVLLKIIELKDKIPEIEKKLNFIKNKITWNSNCFIKFKKIYPGVNLRILDKTYFVEKTIENYGKITEKDIKKWQQ